LGFPTAGSHPAFLANFLKRFGVPAPHTDAGFVIPAEWQSALSNGSSAGGIIGLLVNGWAADRFGPKIVMMISIVALTGFIFIMVFAKSLTMLVIGEVFCGIPWGVFQTLTTAYASEVCPIQLRGYLTAYVNLCWGVGILLSSGVVKATLNIQSDWSACPHFPSSDHSLTYLSRRLAASLHRPVGLGTPTLHHRLLLPAFAMVARAQGSSCRGRGIDHAPYQPCCAHA
jgi:MFS family permease